MTTLNIKSKRLEDKEIEFFMVKDKDNIFEMQTECNFNIKSTKNHPFLTKKGMILLKDLEKNKEIAINTFKGVNYNQRIDRKKAILSKLFGYLLGDGYVNISKNKGYISFYGQKEDLEEIQKDLKGLGFNSNLISRERNHKINTKYGIKEFSAKNYELYNRSKEFAFLLKELGMQLGNKTNQKFLLPDWIMNGEIYVKRLFLAGFFGAELSSPSTHTKTGFYSPILSQNKNTKLKNNAREFLLQITKLLEEFGVKVNKISEDKELVNLRFRLIISAQEDNLLNLYQKIGYEYNKKRKRLADIACLYILKKKQIQKERSEIANKIKEYKMKGFKLKELYSNFSGKVNKRFIERHYYEKCNQRINLDFISFEEFKRLKLKEYEKYGCIFDTIKSIVKLNKQEKVYDFTVKDNHNFIANNFIVSNCGVRILSTSVSVKEFLKKREQLIEEVYKNVPSGLGSKGRIKVTKDLLMEVLKKGTKWAVESGYGIKEDIQRTEEYGCMPKADPSVISDTALKRGMPQLGSLGSGNHFLEVQQVDNIFDEKIAKAFGINKENVTVMIHCGSRGLGHQVASDYIKLMEDKFGFKDLADRELINAPINSDLGQKYYGAMSAAVNFAFANRQMIMHWVRDSFKNVFGDVKIDLIYDVAHNVAKMEKHKIDNKIKEVCLHRKGATRSFGPGNESLPEVYQKTGVPVLIPGSMGTSSYIMVGTKKAEEISFGSTAHGAGRIMSRHSALKQFRGETIKKELHERGIEVKSGSYAGLAEEAPGVYKDIESVIEVSHNVGLASKVAKVVPLCVIKG